MRPEIAKRGGFQGAEALRIGDLVKMTKKFGPMGGGVLTPTSLPLAMPLTTGTNIESNMIVHIETPKVTNMISGPISSRSAD